MNSPTDSQLNHINVLEAEVESLKRKLHQSLKSRLKEKAK